MYTYSNNPKKGIQTNKQIEFVLIPVN
ncbi:hypothetical protein G210_1950 [Candida maltosa Xu316]|uniref:Uncharacterized protein n=1 Tax=Candida maltosa (strain Xu316) TaxID=1245528 RepID=M3JZ03_CANMX|nr:hypothetical protein G210_1950 [Candida maltosa Xu316]